MYFTDSDYNKFTKGKLVVNTTEKKLVNEPGLDEKVKT